MHKQRKSRQLGVFSHHRYNAKITQINIYKKYLTSGHFIPTIVQATKRSKVWLDIIKHTTKKRSLCEKTKKWLGFT